MYVHYIIYILAYIIWLYAGFSSDVSRRQHCCALGAYVRIRQQTSADIRQTSAYVSIVALIICVL